MKRNQKNDLIAALERRQPAEAVPLWEVEFQAWDKFSGKHLVLGREFESLTASHQEQALNCNAEIILSVCCELGFAAVSSPSPFWERARPAAVWCWERATPFKQRRPLRITRRCWLHGRLTEVTVQRAGTLIMIPIY